MPSELTVIVDTQINYVNTAKLANKSFGQGSDYFSESYLKWKYEIAFGGRTSVVAVMYEGQKIGQAAILWHGINFGSNLHGCAQLVDLFVVPEYRSISVVRQIYGKLNELLNEQSDHVVITTPNPKSALLNTRFLKLKIGEELDTRIGLAMPSQIKRTVQSLWVKTNQRCESVDFMQGIVGAGKIFEVSWTPESMADRLSDNRYQYAIHKCGPLLAITSSRTFKGIPLILICGLFTRDSSACRRSHLHEILSAAAILHRRLLYLYVGINRTIPNLPGISLPTRLRPSQMLLQVREGATEQEQIRFSRFEAIDFDFA